MPLLRCQLTVESLENRSLPAVSASFAPATGVLRITVDNDSSTQQFVYVGANVGDVWINYGAVTIPGGPVRAVDVRSITVIGSELANDVWLGWITSAAYQGLDGQIKVDGRGGDDLITGSEFNDSLRGGKGNDVIIGSRGNDRLFGDDGHDRLHGGDDDDVLTGGKGRDYFRGELGRDRVTDLEARELAEYVEVIRRKK